MTSERLSKIQRAILVEIYKYAEKEKSYEEIGAFYKDVLKEVAKKTGHISAIPSVMNPGKMVEIMDSSFASVFSQSIRNMEKKGLIESFYRKELKNKLGRKPWRYESLRKRHKISQIWLTDAGKAKAEAILTTEPVLLL
jgi:hypothetical protein